MTRILTLTLLTCSLCLPTAGNQIQAADSQTSQAPAKLPYPAREAVRRQRSNVDKVEKSLATLQKQATWKAYPYKVEPGLGLTGLLDSIEKDLTNSKAPADHPTVADMLQRVKAVRDALPKLEQTLGEKHAKWNHLADIKNYPHFEADMKRMDELWRMYKGAGESATRASSTRPKQRGDLPSYAPPMPGIEKFAAAAAAYNDDADYFNGAMKRYVVLMKVNPGIKAKIMAKAKTAAKYMNEFHKARDGAVATFPDHIRHNLDVSTKMAAKAMADRQPGFFKGGVKQAWGAATIVLKAYTDVKGAEDATVKELQTAYERVKTELDKTEIALAELILQEAKAPKDSYTGSDKADLVAKVKASYAKQFPQDKVIAVRCSMDAWERKTSWQVNAVEWYKLDNSHLIFSVIVANSDTVATCYPTYVNKNHLKGDKVTVTPRCQGYAERKVLIANLDK